MTLEPKICHACGQMLPEPMIGIFYDPLTRVVSRAGYTGSVRLTPTRGQIFQLLLKHNGHFVHRDVIWNVLYGDRPWNDQPTSRKILDVPLHYMRRALNPLGLFIATSWGTGWRLEPLPRPA